MATLTQPIKWHGGKHYLAKRIIAEMPPRCKNPNAPAMDDRGWLHYVEPFFGGGSVLLSQDPEGISEVVNDLNYQLTNFWTAIKNREWFELMQRELGSTPFSKWEYVAAGMLQKATGVCGPEQAISFFVHCRQSMSGRMDNFAPLTRNRTRRGMNEQASAWLNCIEGLPAVHERLKRVVILNDDAVKVIQQQDGFRTLFYLDPPYLHETRSTTGEYDHEMTREQHIDLLESLTKIEGRFILSSYPSELYSMYAERHGWRCSEIKIDNKASSAKVKEKKTECLWFNY